MTNHQQPFDEHFQRRLSDLESPVPDDLFDRLQARRGAAMPSDAPLRERLAAHESPVSDIIFESILAERARQKRRRMLFWRSATAMAALLLIGAFLFPLVSKKMGLNGAKTIVNSADTEGSNSELINKNKTLKTDIESNDLTLNNGELNASKTTENSAINSELNSAKTLTNSAHTEGSDFELKNKKSALKSTGEISAKSRELAQKNAEKRIKSDAEKRFNAPLINKKQALNTSKNLVNGADTEGSYFELINKNSPSETATNFNKLNTSQTIINSANNSELINKNSELNSAKTFVNSAYTEGSNAELMNKNNALKTDLENRLTPLNSTQLPLDFLNIIAPKTLDLSVEKRKNPCSDPEHGCPTFGKGRRRMGERAFYVDAFVAPEYVMRRFSKNLDESEKLLAARDSVEQTQYAASTGVRASMVLGNGWAVRTGLVFNQINERAHFDSLGVGSITTTYKEVILPNGLRDTVNTIVTIVDGIFRKNRYNHYRSLDIPLQIGYEMPLKNGWTFSFNGGVNVNITAWQKADIVGADLRQSMVSSGINAPNPVFRTRLGMSLTGSVAAYRQLLSGLELVIEPSIRYGLQPITRTDYALKQQYSTAGLIVGLRLRL